MRATRRTLVILLVLAGLFTGADRLAVYLAEQEAADRIRSAEGLSGTESTSVDIRGFPFLTQVLDRNLDEVDVELTGMTAEAGNREITVTQMQATLTDVRLGEGYDTGTAARATGSASISYADLNAIAPPGVKVSYAGADRAARNQVKVKVGIEIFGQELKLPEAIHSTVEVNGDELELHADAVPGASIPGAEAQVRSRIDFTTGVRGLPSGIALDDAEVTERGVRFTLSGTDVPLG
ncbi:DUF2993 domain-containing protein [Streptomyces sp. RKND-216]|uniref:LmeA family phospholipid-binding protein n=1 Tax=Streptomyces sp. RKND-216 TaxID=2562581 RepID=UPI00109DC7E9|nr:DUF2993 domain-containing protein [Streptomyces sp. RKND-216]THA25744.1 DUF2993 domain-containing protein [Streptomyces sp. RKND-216]